MSYKECEASWQTFADLINKLPQKQNEQLTHLVERYIEQNMLIINDVLLTSIENLKKLQYANVPNDVICAQARFATELTKKISISTQRFLNASLGHIADYNEWLKDHCDLATD